jgi:ketosteroid isomerase-like protein
MSERNRAKIIRSLFDAYTSKQREIAEELLTDDFTFTSPYDDQIDKATYFERCWPESVRFVEKYLVEQVLEKIVANGDDVFVLYRCRTNDGKDFRNTEHHVFDGGRIRRIDVYFGATYKDGAFVKAPDV